MEEFVFEEEATIEATFQIDVVSGNHQDLDGRDLPEQHPMGAITGLNNTLSYMNSFIEGKVDKVSIANQVYGTDENGDQTTYNIDSFGQVDDVQVDGISIVENKIADLGTMALESLNDYSTTAVADTLYASISYEGKVDTIENTIGGYGNIVTHDVDEFATAAQGELADTAVQPEDLAEVATTGSYNDLLDKPTIGNATLTIQKNGTAVDTFTANATSDKDINITVPTTAAEVNALPDTTTINDLTSSAQQAALNSGATSTNIGQIATNTSNISTINEKIPAQASSSNQLADKEFVNSSISSNTANFIGTFNDISSLEAYSGTVTNNDYAFVVNRVVTDNGDDWATFTALDTYNKSLLTNFDYAWVVNDSKFDLYRFDIVNQEWVLRAQDIHKDSSLLNTAYNRYKATVSGSTVTWGFEYTLNNSSFTAAQWAAINSGATPTNIGQIATNTSAISDLQNNKQDNLTAGSGIDITSNTVTNTGVRSVSTGATNGTISVNTNGTSAEVAVYGLGSAAYTASTSYDASGAASTAETNAKNYADGLASNYATAAQGALADTALQPADLNGYATETWVGNQGYQTTANLVTSISSLSTDSQYPSAKCMYDLIGDVETLLSQV